jgi:hypothetical protein
VDEAVLRDVDAFDFARQRRTAKAEENNMNTSELQKILGYLNIGLAIAHNTGVSIGHFGSTDFIQLAESVNSMLLNAIAPAVSTVSAVAPVAAATAAAVVISAPADASVAVAS